MIPPTRRNNHIIIIENKSGSYIDPPKVEEQLRRARTAVQSKRKIFILRLSQPAAYTNLQSVGYVLSLVPTTGFMDGSWTGRVVRSDAESEAPLVDHKAAPLLAPGSGCTCSFVLITRALSNIDAAGYGWHHLIPGALPFSKVQQGALDKLVARDILAQM